MNDQIAARIAIALEQIALELTEWNENDTPRPASPEGAQRAEPVHLAVPDPFPAFTWECPIHHQVKTVPAGVSARTGKAYSAFLACPSPGCDEKPPRPVNRSVQPSNVLP